MVDRCVCLDITFAALKGLHKRASFPGAGLSRRAGTALPPATNDQAFNLMTCGRTSRLMP